MKNASFLKSLYLEESQAARFIEGTGSSMSSHISGRQSQKMLGNPSFGSPVAATVYHIKLSEVEKPVVSLIQPTG